MMANLSERVSRGEAAAVARAISKIEDGADGAAELMKEIYQRSRGALVIGITGAPGAGKSSLVDKLAMFYRKNGERVGIVAVDPSSPFSGGAILGDRIRMQALGLDDGVFIRSMATRGNLGGLARATVDAVAILDAAGYAKVIVETVGVGQDEVEIARAADTTLVVGVPGLGDRSVRHPLRHHPRRPGAEAVRVAIRRENEQAPKSVRPERSRGAYVMNPCLRPSTSLGTND